MATFDDVRRAALRLPQAYEDTHRGAPAFRVKTHKFALWWPEDGRAILKLPPVRQEWLFEVRPEVFRPCSVGTRYWSFVALESLDGEEVEPLVTEAWSTLVPAKVSRPYQPHADAAVP